VVAFAGDEQHRPSPGVSRVGFDLGEGVDVGGRRLEQRDPGAGDGIDLEADGDSQAVARSTLLIIDPAPPITIRAAAAITQNLIRKNGQWYIASRTVAAPAGQARDARPATARYRPGPRGSA
jgi:hypothetical protein